MASAPLSSAGGDFHDGSWRNCGLNQHQQPAQPLLHIAAEIDTDGAAMPAGQRLEVTQRLGLLEHPKGELLSRNVDVVDVVRGYLDEHTTVRTALMQLPGGVQKAWTVTGGSHNFFLIADGDADLLQQCLVIVQLFDELGNCEVIAGLDPGDM